ncbi:internal virion protein with endolysin domain [Acinetobacter phage vB_AbaP_46-62_Aci07]|uniref:Putative internal virion protein C n=1 Tax=Acinetobacter phage vB_AbaP_46-62_Aci07 TaxID=2315468 RepID=A0A386KNM8_9CAUD|nr:internal virion protein with endolysin domain [Acinetobacter phage vB_AbaP_46-62_Aci07]AYD85857.1 putative internal virion protein C [Acinetobacter phage vB_AbaP_46-62_Aci07]
MAGLFTGTQESKLLPEVQPELPIVPAGNVPKINHFINTQPQGQADEVDLTTETQQLESLERETPPSILDTAIAGFAPTGRDWLRSGMDKLRYDRDPNFTPDEFTDQFFKDWGMQHVDEAEYLNKAVNYEDWKSRTERIVSKREDAKALAENPITGIAASLIDIDLPLAAIPYLGWAAKGSRMAQIGVRTAQAATAAGAAYGVNYTLEDQSIRSEDERFMDSITFGLGAGLRAIKPVQHLDDAISTELKSLGATDHVIEPHVQQSLEAAKDDIIKSTSMPISTPSGAPSDIIKKHGWLAELSSSYDKLYYLTQGDNSTLVNRLLTGVHNNGDDVATAQAAYLNNYSWRLAGLEKDLSDAVSEITLVKPNPITRNNGSYGRATQETMEKFQESMQRLDAKVLELTDQLGQVPSDATIKQLINTIEPHPSMQRVMRTYIDSGFATRVLDDAKAVGFLEAEGADQIVRRSTYMPVRHSYDRILDAVERRKLGTWDDIAKFYGKQISRIYPELLNPKGNFKLTEKQVGQHFLQTQRDAARNLSEVATTGMTKEQIHDVLTRAGLSNEDASGVTARMFEASKDAQGQPKNLRKRMDWDWNMTYKSSTGKTFGMKDLTDSSTFGNLEEYSRRMAARNGLAQYGIKSEAELDNLLTSYLDKLPKGQDPQRARKFFQAVRDDLLGRPIGEAAPEALRTSQAVADMMLLANSGLYGIIDLATQVYKTGVVRSFPHIYRGLKTAVKGMKGFSTTEAKTLEDIFTGKLIAPSRWKNFMSHYSDGYSVSNGIHEAAQYYSQSTRFLNLSEYLKRFQIGMLMGVYGDVLRGVANGNARDIKYMKNKMKVSDELLSAIQTEWKAKGGNIDSWSNATRVALEQKIFNESDNLAFNIQKGEVPSILEHSTMGKVVFPYMRYAFAMQQKVLRRTLNRDGAVGLALLMAAQMPAAMLVGAAINVRNGKEPDDDLAKMTVKTMSALGSWNYPLEMLIGGVDQSSVTALAPLGKTWNFVNELATGEPDLITLKKNSIANSAILLDALALAFED